MSIVKVAFLYSNGENRKAMARIKRSDEELKDYNERVANAEIPYSPSEHGQLLRRKWQYVAEAPRAVRGRKALLGGLAGGASGLIGGSLLGRLVADGMGSNIGGGVGLVGGGALGYYLGRKRGDNMVQDARAALARQGQ